MKEAKAKQCSCVSSRPRWSGSRSWFRLVDGRVLLPCDFNAEDRHCIKCMSCGEICPFGPSVDSPDVLIEIRAAEIVELSKADPLTRILDDEEGAGWRDWPFDYGETSSKDPGRNAGWLARAILEHFDDRARQDRVNGTKPAPPTGHEVSQSAGLHERLERVSADLSRAAKVA